MVSGREIRRARRQRQIKALGALHLKDVPHVPKNSRSNAFGKFRHNSPDPDPVAMELRKSRGGRRSPKITLAPIKGAGDEPV